MKKVILLTIVASMALCGCTEHGKRDRKYKGSLQEGADGTTDGSGTSVELYNSMSSPCDLTLAKAYARLAIKNPDLTKETEFDKKNTDNKNIYDYLAGKLTVYPAPLKPRQSPFDKRVCFCYGQNSPCSVNGTDCMDRFDSNENIIQPEYDKKPKVDVPYYLIKSVTGPPSLPLVVKVAKEELRAYMRSICLVSIDYVYRFNLPIFIGSEKMFRKIAATAYDENITAVSNEEVFKAWMVFNALQKLGLIKQLTVTQAAALPKTLRFSIPPDVDVAAPTVPNEPRLPNIYYFDKPAITAYAR